MPGRPQLGSSRSGGGAGAGCLGMMWELGPRGSGQEWFRKTWALLLGHRRLGWGTRSPLFFRIKEEVARLPVAGLCPALATSRAL